MNIKIKNRFHYWEDQEIGYSGDVEEFSIESHNQVSWISRVSVDSTSTSLLQLA
jgi:hypothetical protein